MSFKIFKKDSKLDIKKLNFRRCKNIWDLRYKENSEGHSKTMYIQTPALKLSLIEEDKDNYYLVCRVNDNDEKFWDLITDIDMATIEEMSEDTAAWGLKADTPLTFIEKRFIPTLKMSSINYEYSLHLVVPKTDQVYIYDQNGETIKMNDLRRNFRLTLLLLVDGIEFKNNYFSLKFLIEQIKAKLPESSKDKNQITNQQIDKTTEIPLGECVLEESIGDHDQDQEEFHKYSHHPREDLYASDPDDLLIDERGPNKENKIEIPIQAEQIYDDQSEDEEFSDLDEVVDQVLESLHHEEEPDDLQAESEQFEDDLDDGITLDDLPESVLDRALAGKYQDFQKEKENLLRAQGYSRSSRKKSRRVSRKTRRSRKVSRDSRRKVSRDSRRKDSRKSDRSRKDSRKIN